MSPIITKIQEILRDLLNSPGLEIGPDTSAPEVPGWDSLAHINLVICLEEEFSIKFALAELQSLQNVGEMAELIEEKIS